MNQRDSRLRTKEIFSVLLIDLLAVLVSYYCGYFVKFHTLRFKYEPEMYTIFLLISILFCVSYTMLVNHSNEFLKRGHLIEFFSVTKYNICLLAGGASILFLVKFAEDYSRLMFGYFIIINEIITYVFHILLKKYLRKHYRDEKNQTKLLVICEEEAAEKLCRQLKDKIDVGYYIEGVVLWRGEDKTSSLPAELYIERQPGESPLILPVFGDESNFLEKVKLLALDEVFIYLPNQTKTMIREIINTFKIMGVTCHYNIDVADLYTNVRSVDTIAGFTVVSYSMNQVDYNKRMIKRIVDIVGALIGCMITLLVMPFVAIAVKLESKGPILFKQKRVGRNGRIFHIYKFRSMYIDAEERKKELEAQNEMSGLMFKMEHDPRITKVGNFLRKTSIDELPQFFNILKGDMSLVGTRPPTVDEYEKYNFHYKRRLSMTPGLTGMWQVNGRSEITNFDDVVKYDLEYIDNWSLTLDLKILFQTIGVVLFRKGSK